MKEMNIFGDKADIFFFFLDCVLVIMIISFTSVIPESRLERFFRVCVGGWKLGPLPPCLIPSPSAKPRESSIVKSPVFPEALALSPQVLVGEGTDPKPGLTTLLHQGALQGQEAVPGGLALSQRL